MNKKVSIGMRPTAVPSSDKWVAERVESEAVKRLTIDIPASLHGQIKSSCALRGVKMAEELRELLEKHYR